MAQLTVSQTFDYRGGAAETSIDKIAFSNVSGLAIATFGWDQFGPGLISNSLTLEGSAGTNSIQLVATPGVQNFSAANWSFQNWSSNDTISFFGTSGSNAITGSSQQDTISTGGGLDTIDAGNGDDVIRLNGNPSGGSVFGGGQGSDRLVIQTSGATDLTAVTLSSIEALAFLEDGQTARLTGGQFGSGKIGTIVGAANSEHALEVSGVSVDLSELSFLGWKATNTVNIFGIGVTSTNLIGSDLADTITGALSAENTIAGGTGSDILLGGSQNDTFRYLSESEAAGDTINGGSGIDTIRFEAFGFYNLVSQTFTDIEQLHFQANAAVQISEGVVESATQPFKIIGSNGQDGLSIAVTDGFLDLSGVTFQNWGEVESGDSITFAGTALADTFIGSSQSDRFYVAAGDQATGGAGDDIFYAIHSSAKLLEAAGQGHDVAAVYSSFALSAGQSIEELVVHPEADDGDFNLYGNELANRIVGNIGSNILNGGGGIDTLEGLDGNDQYYVDQAGDVVQELAGQGNDRVLASSSYTLGAGVSVEILSTTLTSGTTAINLVGNELANAIVGNAGANILNGRGGTDTLRGFGGNDQYYVDHTGDVVLEVAGEGTDRVLASTGYTLGSGVSAEFLTTTNANGMGAINLFGNELAQTIIGNQGINILQGGGGADALTPGSDSAADTIRFAGVSDSTGLARDTVTGLDLGGEDKLDFTLVPTGAIGFVGGNLSSGASFNTDIAAAVNGALGPKGAVLFDPTGGTLNTAGHAYLVVDANNDGSYTAGADYLVQLINTTGTLDLTDFV